MSAQPTPLPWRLTGEQTRQGETVIRGPPKTDPAKANLVGEPVAYAADFNRFDRDGEREANAALIVRAVNNHEAPVAALAALQDVIEEAEEQGDLVPTGRLRDVQSNVRSVLAQARRGP